MQRVVTKPGANGAYVVKRVDHFQILALLVARVTPTSPYAHPNKCCGGSQKMRCAPACATFPARHEDAVGGCELDVVEAPYCQMGKHTLQGQLFFLASPERRAGIDGQSPANVIENMARKETGVS